MIGKHPLAGPAAQRYLTPHERAKTEIEGWILGVPGLIR